MQIYIVSGEVGDYSERRSWCVTGFFDEEKAKVLVRQLNEFTKFNNEFATKYKNEFYDPYLASHPWPKSDTAYYGRVKTTPEWQAYQAITKGGKKGTDEQNARFRELNAERRKRGMELKTKQQEAFRIHAELMGEWTDAMEKARHEWLDAHLNMAPFAHIDPKDLSNMNMLDCTHWYAQYHYYPMDVRDTPPTWNPPTG